MLRKLPKTALLSAYLAAMLFLDLWILAHAWGDITRGLPDFTIFYTAGKILQMGRAPDLYDNSLQKEVQEAVTPVGFEKRGLLLPYNHPPFEAVLFPPLSHLSYLAAYLTWVGLNILLLVWLALKLRRVVLPIGRLPAYLWLLAALTFHPIFIALLQGQDSILLLGCFTLAYLCLLRRADFRAGVWLGLGLFKFNLILPFALPLLLVNRKKLAAGFLSVALALLLLSVVVFGWRILLIYPAYVWSAEHEKAYPWNRPSVHPPNLRGLSYAFTSDPLLGRSVLVLLSAVVLFAIILVWHTLPSRSGSLQRAFAIGILGAVLLSFHVFIHDLSVLLLALVAVVEYLSHRPIFERWVKVSLYSCMAILFCSPLYLLLFFRFRRLEWMALILLVLFVVLVWDALRPQGEAREGSAVAVSF
ncbi:MAG TPA: glycosyltransferase family 87 protein [Terriglobales bacterium]|nr:glycosyltransferase family 87 protein [Terriglobales bacterium]